MLGNILEIITIGLPFCAFKFITGFYFQQSWLMALAIIDFIINIINLASLIFQKRRIFDACFFSFIIVKLKKPQIAAKEKWQDLGAAIDVLLSFSLVAYIIGGGFIKYINPIHLNIWNISVVLNVFGAGYARLVGSINNLKV